MHRTSPFTHRNVGGLAHLLGRVDFVSAQALQQRLVYETGGARRPQATWLLCEHPDTISIGRHGSRAHVDLEPAELESDRLAIHWVGRGGGAIPHAPGQLALYPIVPLVALEMSVGEYLRRLQDGIAAALGECGVSTQPGEVPGLWGRGGQLVVIGLAVRDWIAFQGAFIQVENPRAWAARVHADFTRARPMGSLAAESQRPVRMSKVREALLRHVPTAIGLEPAHILSGHPLLVPTFAPPGAA